MQREIRITRDGSTTLYVPELGEHYHSVHGAIQESLHVFIKSGLLDLNRKQVSILEIGFGTGLNAWLTAIAAAENDINVKYTGVEKHPLTELELQSLNYQTEHSAENGAAIFDLLHQSEWGNWVPVSKYFQLNKEQKSFKEIDAANEFDLIYYDAFAPEVQPDLWTVDMFTKMYSTLKNGGVLVTYCAKGQVKRNLKEVGFSLEALPGPPGKREMTRVTKPI